MKKILLSPWLALVTLAIILTVRFMDPEFSQVVRLKYFDQLITSQPDKESSVTIVNIDEATLEKYGQFPFPRGVYAKIIDDLYKRNAGLVVFGVMMPEADRFGEDGKLAAVLSRHPVILPQVAAERGKNDEGETTAQVIGNTEAMVTYGGVIASVPVIQNQAAGVGVVNTMPEIDGVVRRLPLVVSTGDRVHPALALETVRIASGDTKFQVKAGPHGVEALRIPEFGKIPVDGLGRVWVDYSVKSPEYSAVNLPDDLGGKIVVVGLSAAGLVQPVATGRGEIWPQDLQATVIGTMLNGTNISRPDSADLLELVAIFFAGISLLILTRWMYVGIATLTIMSFGSVFASMYAYSHYLYLIDITTFVVGIVLVSLHAYVVKFMGEFFQKQQIKKQFSSYVNPAIVERLQKNPEFIKLGGEKRDLTIVFTDMRNFTGLGETYGDDVVAFTAIINRYMTAISEPVMRNNGCLIKFVGDASLHVHGAPIQEEQDPDHCIAAVRTGLEMIRAVELFNVELEREGKPKVALGAGINTGPTLIGNIGAVQRFSYDVLGDSVSLAARLESQTKNYGQTIIISEFTESRVREDFFTIELDNLAVKGKSVGVTIYTVFYNPDSKVAADWIMARELHDLMLAYYRRQEWDKALALCNELVGEFDGNLDEYYSKWQDRIAEMRTRDLPSDWSGTYVATSK